MRERTKATLQMNLRLEQPTALPIEAREELVEALSELLVTAATQESIGEVSDEDE